MTKKVSFLLVLALVLFPAMALGDGARDITRGMVNVFNIYIYFVIIGLGVVMPFILWRNKGVFKKPFLLYLVLTISFILLAWLATLPFYLPAVYEPLNVYQKVYLLNLLPNALAFVLFAAQIFISFFLIKKFKKISLPTKKIIGLAIFLGLAPLLTFILWFVVGFVLNEAGLY